MNLSQIKKILLNKGVLAGVAIIVILVLVVPILFLNGNKVTPKDLPPPVSQQPIKNQKFDENAKISQTSKNSIDKIKNQLPYRQTITSSTSSQVTYTLIYKPKDPYSVYIEIIGVDFNSNYTDANLPKNIENFRETAQSILSWLKSQNVDTAQTFIIWGSTAQIQKTAEAWLLPSPKFPEVTREGNNFKFTVEPQKN